jgi:mRNA interferase MazF
VVVVQSNAFNRSRIGTVVVAVVTSNLSLAKAPGNVLLKKGDGKILRESVVNVSQLLTLDRRFLTERLGRLPPPTIAKLDEGLRLVMAL